MGAMVTCPLDVVKTRFQALHNKQALEFERPLHRPKFVHAFVVIYKQEGLRGLWKGIGPNLLGVFPSRYLTITIAKNCSYSFFCCFFQ